MGGIYQQAEKMAQQHGTRNPYELLNAMGATLWLAYEFDPDGLKGFAAIMNGALYACVNGNLPEEERKIVAGHEAAHLILHKDEIQRSPANTIKDFKLYDNSGKLEFEANSFLADFLVPDAQVMEMLRETNGEYFFAAKMLHLPPPLLAFKLHGMIRRGYNLKNPVMLHSGFLGKNGMW